MVNDEPNPGLARRITNAVAGAATSNLPHQASSLVRRMTRQAGEEATKAVDKSELTVLGGKWMSEEARIAAMGKFDLSTAAVAVPFTFFSYSVYKGWTTTGECRYGIRLT